MASLSLNQLRATQRLCLHLNKDYPDFTFLQTTPQYHILSMENWSKTAWANPTCIVRPANTSVLQDTVRLLSSHYVPFAVRSGDHMPPPLGANINAGVLISLSSLDEKNYDPERGVIEVGGGLKWRDVYSYLDEYKVTVVGGRVLESEWGLLYSEVSPRKNSHTVQNHETGVHGLACDSAANFQVVVANGSLVNSNRSSHQDLFCALKGGANNFGAYLQTNQAPRS
jgi:FAD/FMN-containing dehydrogenase